MSDSELKLLKCLRYDKSETHDRSEDGYEWSAKENATALNEYLYQGKPYAVTADWYYSGSGDGVDSDHYESLTLTVHPIPPEDLYDEAKVLAAAQAPGYKHQVGDRPQVSIRSQEAFNDDIHFKVIDAIGACIANEKKKTAEASGEKAVPNVVKVYKEGVPDAKIVYDFDSDAGLGHEGIFYRCSSVCVEALDEESRKEFGIDRALCYYYPAERGTPHVYACEGRIGVYFSNWWDTGSSAVICACENGKPAPLTPDEVQKVLNFPTKD